LVSRARVGYSPSNRSIVADGLEGVADIAVFDMAGRCVARLCGQRIARWAVPMQSRATGVYFVHLRMADGARGVRPVTVF